MPLVLGAIALIGSAAIIWMRFIPELDEVRRVQSRELAIQANVLRNGMSDLFDRGEVDLAERRLADVAADPRLDTLAVIGGDGRVAFTNRAKWLHMEATRLEGFQPSQAAQAEASRRDLMVSQGESHLTGFFPVESRVIPGANGNRTYSMLFVAYDLGAELAIRRHEILIKASWLLGLQLLLVLLLGSFLDFQVSRKVDRLTNVMRDIEVGRMDARCRMEGAGDLSRLGRGLDHLMDRLEANQQVLAEQEELFRSAMTHSATGIVLLTFEGRYLKVNPAFCAMVGYTEPELLGQSLQAITHPDDRVTDAENIRRMLAHETIVGEIEKRYIRKDGQVVHAFVSPAIVWDAEHRPRFFVSHIQDITARKEAEATLAASQAKFRLLLEAAAIPISVAHISGRLEYLNRRFTQTLGYTIEDIPDLDAWWLRAYPDESYREQVRHLWMEAVQEAMKTGADIHPNVEFQVRRKDGTICILEITGAFVGDQVIVALHDLTLRVEAEARLRDALEFNQAMTEAQPMGLLAYHAASGQCVMASPGFSSAIGAIPQQVLGQNFRQLESWRRSGLFETAERAIATGEPQYIETLLKTTFGKQLWLAAHFATFASRGEKHLLLLAVNITDRILADMNRWESERRLLTLMEGVDQISVMLDLEGQVTFCNDFLLQLTGWRREEVVGQGWFQRFISEDWSSLRRFFLDAVQNGHIDLHHENLIQSREGELRLVQWTNTLLYDAEGAVAGTASLGKDITDLRQSEEALRASEEKFSRIFQSSPDATIITDLDSGRVIDVNPAFTRTLGYQHEEALGHVTGPDDLELWVEPEERRHFLRQLSEYGKVVNSPADFRRKDGQVIHVLVSTTMIDMDGGRCALSVIRDITDHRRVEEERRLLEIQVQRSQKLESLGSLAGGMAHDMNNVLGAILGIASIHQEAAPQGSPIQRAMDIIIKACVRGRTLVQGLLGFARRGASGAAGDRSQ